MKADQYERSGPALSALFISVFVLGTSELLVVGLLDQIAAGAGVSVSSAGALVTTYAVGFAIGGPIVSVATRTVAQRPVLLGLLSAYLAVTCLMLASPSFGALLALRACAGAVQGAYIGRAITAALGLVPPDRAGRAVSVVAGAIAVSTSAGVPLGTWLGRSADWSSAFASVALLNALAIVGVAALVPTASASTKRSEGHVRQALRFPVLAVLVAIAVFFAGQYAALTYIAPFLLGPVGVESSSIAVYLMVYGAATAVGAFLGGRAADASIAATMVVSGVVTTAVLTCVVMVSGSSAAILVLLACWGVFGFGIVPAMQNRVASLAGPGAELAASFPAAASNAGIALGATWGGAGWFGEGETAPILVGAIVCGVGAVLIILTSRLGRQPVRLTPRQGAADPAAADRLYERSLD